MDRRTIIAIFLIVLIFALYPEYQRRVLKLKPPKKTTLKKEKTKPKTESSLAKKEEKREEEVITKTISPVDTIQPEIINVETDLYKMRISNRGVNILEYKLKKYKDFNFFPLL